MKIEALITWMTENKDRLTVSEILAPLWGGNSHLLLRLESPNWLKVSSKAIVEPALSHLKSDAKETVSILLTPSKSQRKRIYVQTAPKASRKSRTPSAKPVAEAVS